MCENFSYKMAFSVVLFFIVLTAVIFADSAIGLSVLMAVCLLYIGAYHYIIYRSEKIGKENQAFEALWRCSEDAVLVFEDSGNAVFMNETARKLFSSDRKFCFSQMLRELNMEDTVISEIDKEKSHYTVRNILFGENFADVTFAGFDYIEKNKRKSGIICSIHDISERGESEHSAVDFATVSHELRTPLTGIQGAVETVLLYPTLDSEMRNRLLEMAVDECDRMKRIISDFSVLSHLDRNDTDWRIESFDTVGFLDRAYDVFLAEAQQRRHVFVKDYPQNLPAITGDKERLQQVLLNVLSNAMKYTDTGGKITLQARAEDRGISVCVSDTGIGISQEELPHLFERFYRSEKAKNSKSEGMGIGLVLAKEMIDAHGGKIEIESIPERGTCVRMFFPYESKIKNEINKTEAS